MKYNVLVHLWLTCVWRPMRNGSWKKPNVYRKAACRSYRFLWPLFSLWSSISLSDFQLGVFLLLQCINLSNFHVLSVLKRKYNFMYLVDCRCVKRRAVLHKIHMPLFGFTDVHQKKTLSHPALLAAEVVPIATKTLKAGNSIVPLLQLNSTQINTCWPSKKYNFTLESFQININKA